MAFLEKTKAPNAVLKYKWNWRKWLEELETISSQTVTPPSGITVSGASITDGGKSVTATVSGGTAGTAYDVVCQIVTSDGETDERTIRINVALT